MIWLLTVAAICSQTQAETIESLSQDLASPQYQIARTARKRLLSLDPKRPEGKAASAALDEFDRRAIRWLVKVGNAEEDVAQKKCTSVTIELREATPVAEMAFLYDLTELGIIRFHGKHVTDNHVRAAMQIAGIELLDISETSVSGTFLAGMEFPNLQCLRINDSPLAVQSLETASLPKLAVFNAEATSFTTKALSSLSAKQLTGIYVAGTEISDEGLASALAGYRDLQSLGIDSRVVRGDVAELITKMNLRHLRVRCRPEDLPAIEALRKKMPASCRLELIADK